MIVDLYPFSTKDAKVIPLDIIRPASLAKIPFLSASATVLADLSLSVPILVLRSSTDCYIRFGATAEVPSTALIPDLLYLPAGTVMVIAPEVSTYSVIGATENGDLWIQVIERWAGLGLETQFDQI